MEKFVANPTVHLNGQPREGDRHLLGAHDPLRRLGHDHIQLGSLLEKGFLKGIPWFRGISFQKDCYNLS